jgi:MFS family permease
MVTAPASVEPSSSTPARAGSVLAALILVAAVANLNLAVANVALPDIGKAFDASQTELNLVAVGYSLGLAASVLYLGALGDRYGRKLMLILGIVLSIPACFLAAWAHSVDVLIVARLLGGLSAGMAYPTTLALITALWSGPERTKAIALWSALGGAVAALGPLTAGAMLEHFWWGSVFLITLPLAAVALVLAVVLVPSHVNETTEPVDNLGGFLSIVLVAGLVLAINFAAVPNAGALVAGLVAITLASGVAFVIRQRRAPEPLYDLRVASRRIFWVAAAAGVIVFGTLMGAMFIGQQYLQNVLGYSTVDAGAAILPAVFCMVLVAPRSAHLVETRGARTTLLVGYACCLLGFLTMLLLWTDSSHYPVIGIAYAFVGAGVGFAGTPASHSLTGSVPVTRAGMASGTADLQRDLGGAIMQSILGALLTAGYAAAVAAAIAAAPNSAQITDSVQSQLQKSFAGAEAVAQRYPQYAAQITAGARSSFLDGADWAYAAGIIAILLGAVIVFFFFPKAPEEKALLARYHEEDTAAAGPPVAPTTPRSPPEGDAPQPGGPYRPIRGETALTAADDGKE